MTYKSDDTGILFGALSKAQGSYKVLAETQDSSVGKFAGLADILRAVRDALSTNGLSIYQYVELTDKGDGASLLWTSLGHESGQYINSCSRIIQYPTFRETSNAIEDYKRMHATMLLGIAPSPNDPLLFADNGSENMRMQTVRDMRTETKTVVSEHQDKITKDQYEDINYELEGFPGIARGILKAFNITALADIPKTEFYKVQNEIRKIKKTHEELIKSEK